MTKFLPASAPPMRLLPLFILWCLALSPAFAGLKVDDARWGFSGKMTPDTFNVLSVIFSNPGPQNFDGPVTLKSDNGYAPVVQPLFLPVGQTKTVQFVALVGRNTQDFSLSWGRGFGESISVTENVKMDIPAAVILGDPSFIRQSRMPVFPESLFPVSVSATDGLHAVVLDHMPRFDAPKAQAFMDWVRAGGLVHVCPGATSETAEFTGELSGLNIPGESARVGAGWVIKHKTPISEITETQLENKGYRIKRGGITEDNNNNNYWRNDDEELFKRLAAVTRPKISWGLIYLLTFVYIALIGPVFFVNRKRDYRILLGGFVVTVLLFSWLFLAVGRRGYGENQVCHTVSVARVLGGGRFDVAHWAHAFATTGDTYRLKFPGTSQFYGAVGRPGETVRGVIASGRDAFMDADIPLFSFRNFNHRGVMQGPAFEVKSLEARDANFASNQTQWKQSFKMKFTSPPPGEVIDSLVQVDTTFFRTKISGDELTLGSETLSQPKLKADSDYDYGYSYQYRYYGQGPEGMDRSGPYLARKALAEPNNTKGGIGRQLAPKTARLYLFVSDPSAFRLEGDRFAAGESRVLFIQDIPFPESTTR